MSDNTSPNSTPTVKIYSTPTCVYCRLAKQFLSENKIAYEEINVAADQKALAEMVSKSHQMGVPVIDVNGEVFVGFDKEGLARALKLGDGGALAQPA